MNQMNSLCLWQIHVGIFIFNLLCAVFFFHNILLNNLEELGQFLYILAEGAWCYVQSLISVSVLVAKRMSHNITLVYNCGYISRRTVLMSSTAIVWSVHNFTTTVIRWQNRHYCSIINNCFRLVYEMSSKEENSELQ